MMSEPSLHEIGAASARNAEGCLFKEGERESPLRNMHIECAQVGRHMGH